MNNSNSFAVVTALVAVVIAIIGIFTPVGRAAFGGISNFDQLDAADGFSVDGTTVIDGSGNIASGAHTLTVGSNGTALTRVNAGFCTIVAYSNTIAASSSALVDCLSNSSGSVAGGLAALTGVTSGDVVNASISTSSSSLYGGIFIGEASASNTTGVIQLRIVNATGGTFTWSAGASTTAVGYTAIDI